MSAFINKEPKRFFKRKILIVAAKASLVSNFNESILNPPCPLTGKKHFGTVL